MTIIVGCSNESTDLPVPQQAESETAVATTDSNTTTAYIAPESGYPADQSTQGYVAPESNNPALQDTPPNPEIDMPQPTAGGAIVGVLIREVVGEGFLPLTPRGLFLAKVILNDQGEPALLRRGDDAPQAQLFPTGIFMFNNITPDTYAIIADFGFSQFPLLDDDGNQLMITVEEGQTLDLGQIFVTLPE